MLTNGQILNNRYRILSLLGQGGMGAVYHAYELNLQRECVVKELVLQGGFSYDAVQQFEREAKTLASLNHSRLPRVTDYFQLGSNYFLVMDFVRGHNLLSLIGTAGLAEAVVRGYAEQLLEVLGYIHAQGVLHRDIKPDNIIIRNDGQAVLVDFGLVKAINTLTQPFLQGYGTAAYAAPEQYSGGTDARSDLYSLGATLYHALTGIAPISGADRMAGAALPDPRQHKPGLSPALAAVVMKALAMNRQDRFQTVREMKDALSSINGQSENITRIIKFLDEERIAGRLQLPPPPATQINPPAQGKEDGAKSPTGALGGSDAPPPPPPSDGQSHPSQGASQKYGRYEIPLRGSFEQALKELSDASHEQAIDRLTRHITHVGAMPHFVIVTAMPGAGLTHTVEQAIAHAGLNDDEWMVIRASRRELGTFLLVDKIRKQSFTRQLAKILGKIKLPRGLRRFKIKGPFKVGVEAEWPDAERTKPAAESATNKEIARERVVQCIDRMSAVNSRSLMFIDDVTDPTGLEPMRELLLERQGWTIVLGWNYIWHDDWFRKKAHSPEDCKTDLELVLAKLRPLTITSDWELADRLLEKLVEPAVLEKLDCVQAYAAFREYLGLRTGSLYPDLEWVIQNHHLDTRKVEVENPDNIHAPIQRAKQEILVIPDKNCRLADCHKEWDYIEYQRCVLRAARDFSSKAVDHLRLSQPQRQVVEWATWRTAAWILEQRHNDNTFKHESIRNHIADAGLKGWNEELIDELTVYIIALFQYFEPGVDQVSIRNGELKFTTRKLEP